MEKIGFFEAMFHDIGYREREALNEAAHSLTMQDIATSHNSRGLEKLFALDRVQAEEIARLRVMVEVLSEMLVDSKVLSKDTLALRVKDSFRILEESKHPVPSKSAEGHPFRGGPSSKEAVAPEPVTSCTRCGEQVYARNTQITANGTICDGCYYK